MAHFEYRLRVRLPTGELLRAAPFLTPRRRVLGDLIRLPLRPDGELYPGEGFDWRVTSVEDGGTLLVVEFPRRAA